MKRIIFIILIVISFHDTGIYGQNVKSIYPSIKDDIYRDSSLHIYTLLSGRTYTGSNNKNLTFTNLNFIMSSSSNEPAIIDCEGNGRAFDIINSQVTLINIKFKNCKSSLGGALKIGSESEVFLNFVQFEGCISDRGTIYVSDSKLDITNSRFTSNTVKDDGGAIHITDKSDVKLDDATTFSNNVKLAKFNDVPTITTNDISIYKQSVLKFGSTLAPFTNPDSVVVACSDDSIAVDYFFNSVCNSFDDSLERATPKCDDGKCDTTTEDYFNCPNDCKSTYYHGFLHKQYQCPIKNTPNTLLNGTINEKSNQCETIISPHTEPILNAFYNQDGVLSGQLFGYFKMKADGTIYFRFNVSNMNIKVYINNKIATEYQSNDADTGFVEDFYQWIKKDNQVHQLSFSKYLVNDITHQITIQYQLKSNFIFGNRIIGMEYSMFDESNYKPLDHVFYSYNICGDGILNENERCDTDSKAQPTIKVKNIPSLNPVCGNGICDEEDPNTCLVDCYKYISERCSPLFSSSGALVPNEVSGDDALSTLISNQVIYRLPGYQHFAFGYDIVYGEQRSYPIFQFGFCDTSESTFLEDVYRGMLYETPKELSVTPLPKCNFEIETNFYSSSSQLKQDMSSKYAYSTNGFLSIGGKGIPYPIKAEASASYSKEKSVSTSVNIEKKKSGSLIESKVNCQIFNVELNEYTFSLNFLRDISNAVNTQDFFNLIKMYGTHFYKTAVLGGSLKQYTSTTESMSSTESQSEMTELSSLNLKFTITSPYVNFGSSATKDDSSSSSTNLKSKYEGKTAVSSIITQGGAPGSYGPSTSEAPTTYGDWAQTVDLLPVPIDPKLVPIRNIIPVSWVTAKNDSIRELWVNAETLYYQLYGTDSPMEVSGTKKETGVFWYTTQSLKSATNKLTLKMHQAHGYTNSAVDLRAVVHDIDINPKPIGIATPNNDFITLKGIYDEDQSFDYSYINQNNHLKKGYTVIIPDFSVDWKLKPVNSSVRLESTMTNKATRITDTKIIIDYWGNKYMDPNPIKLIDNMMFITDTETTTKAPTTYIWEFKGKSSPITDIPVWKPYYFNNNGELYEPPNKDIGYLLIPPMNSSYTHIAINIMTGGYNFVIYVSSDQQIKKGDCALISIQKEYLPHFLVSTSIDYTPNYDKFGGKEMGEFKWYTNSGPLNRWYDDWYWDSNQVQEMELWPKARDFIRNNYFCPYLINFLGEVRNCTSEPYYETRKEISYPHNTYRVYELKEGFTSFVEGKSEHSYFFLPNNKGEYVSLAIPSTPVALGGEPGTTQSPRLYHRSTDLDGFSINRGFDHLTWYVRGKPTVSSRREYNQLQNKVIGAIISPYDAKSFSDRYWSGVKLPVEGWFPPNLPVGKLKY